MATTRKTGASKGWVVCLAVLILILIALILVWLRYPVPSTTTTSTTTTTIKLSGDLPAVPLSMPPSGAEPMNLPREK